MFAHESFVLTWFLRISKQCLGKSINLPMRTQNQNLSCASAFVRQSRIFHSVNALCTFYRMHTFLIDETFYPEYPSGLIWIQTVFANGERERERERERLVQARQSKHCIGGSTSREREVYSF